MTSYDEWKLAPPPYWEEPEEWESAKCKECEYFCELNQDTELCLSEPILNDEPRADLIHGDSQACEVFERKIA